MTSADPDDPIAGLLELEHRGWRSLCEGSGAAFYGDLMTEDGVMVLANGAVLDRDAVVRSLEQSPTWRTYAIDDPRLVRTGPNSVALVYVGTGYREAEEPAFVGVMTSVYVRSGDAWGLALYQQTPVPSGG